MGTFVYVTISKGTRKVVTNHEKEHKWELHKAGFILHILQASRHRNQGFSRKRSAFLSGLRNNSNFF